MIAFTGHPDVTLPPAEVSAKLADMHVLDRWHPNLTTSTRTITLLDPNPHVLAPAARTLADHSTRAAPLGSEAATIVDPAAVGRLHSRTLASREAPRISSAGCGAASLAELNI